MPRRWVARDGMTGVIAAKYQARNLSIAQQNHVNQTLYHFAKNTYPKWNAEYGLMAATRVRLMKLGVQHALENIAK